MMKKKMLTFFLAGLVLTSPGVQGAEMEDDLQYEGGTVSLTLADSIDLALAGDESIEAAQAGREAARWGLSAARRAKGPTLSWSAQAYRIGGKNYKSYNEAHDEYGDPHKVSRIGLVGYVATTGDPVINRQTGTVGAYAYHNTFANSWNITVPIYTGGQLENQAAARRYQLNQADLTLENTRQTVRYKAAEAYANLLHRRNLEKIAQEAVDMAQTQLGLIGDQYIEGSVAKADVLTMEVRLANCRQNLVNAQAAAKVAQSTLASILGLPQDTEIEALDIFSYEPYGRTLPECEAYALLHRPDGLAAEYAIKSAQAQVGVAKAGNRPKISGVAGDSIASNHPFGHERSSAWEAGINLSWNIFDNGVTSASVHQAQALTDQSQAEARRVWKNIRLETRSAYTEMKAAEENIAGTAKAVRDAEESYMIAQVRYEEGVDILLTVTDAQERLTQARSNYNTALYQYNLYRAGLEKAIGVPVEFDPAVYTEAEQQGASADQAVAKAEVNEESDPDRKEQPWQR